MNPIHRFGLIDWTVVVAYAAILLAVGFRLSRRQRTVEEYFLGNRQARPFLAGISLFAGLFSIISYIGTTGEYVQYGPALVVQSNILMMPFLYVLVGWLLIPAIMRLPITSGYELLEASLGRGVRKAGSFIYIITRLVWMALILYVTSTVLVSVVGCDRRWGHVIIVLTGLVTTTYTLCGGIRTVMITEVVQFFMMLAGTIITLVSVSWRLGGVAPWWPSHWEPHWPAQPFFSLDPHVRANVVGATVAWAIVALCSAGSDQAAIQRFLTTRDAQAARRAFLLNLIANTGVSILLALVGAALLAYFHLHPREIPQNLSFAKDGDSFFPLYISRYLPTGISGLLVASLLAASMSCLSSGITAITTVITKDFIETSRAGAAGSDAAQMRSAHLLALAIGVVIVFGSLAMGSVRGDIIEVTSKTTDLLAAPIFGLFFLAIFVEFATPFGAILGAIYSIAAAVLIGYWDVLKGGPPVTFLWIAPIALAVSMSGGCLFSLVPSRGRSPSALAGLAAASVLPLIVIIVWLLR